MAEPIDIKKAITSPLTGVYWVKVIMYGLGLSALLFIGYGVYKAYFKKPATTQAISVQSGGQVTIRNEAAKKNWYIFTEPYIGVDTEHKTSVGVRAGVRWEF